MVARQKRQVFKEPSVRAREGRKDDDDDRGLRERRRKASRPFAKSERLGAQVSPVSSARPKQRRIPVWLALGRLEVRVKFAARSEPSFEPRERREQKSSEREVPCKSTRGIAMPDVKQLMPHDHSHFRLVEIFDEAARKNDGWAEANEREAERRRNIEVRDTW